MAQTNDRRLSAFFPLTYTLAIPFYGLQYAVDQQLLPGLPLASLAVLCPATAALLLEYRRAKGKGVRQLLMRSFDQRRIRDKRWYLPVLLLYPGLVILSYIMLRAAGINLPAMRIGFVPAILMALTFFIAALSEELGWSGYATGPLQNRFGTLKAGLLLGIVWAAWHWIPLLQVHRTAGWIAWWTLYTVSARVIMVWLFIKAGQSVFAMALFHTTLNLAWQLFPVNGSHFDIRLVALLTAAVAAMVAMDHQGLPPGR